MPIAYIPRILESEIRTSLQHNPATAVLGPRQCGKSTLVKHLIESEQEALYLDLERPSDLRKLDNAEWFLGSQTQRLVCLDEIQRKPELFPLLRSLIDEASRKGMYLILGSASRDLLKQSSETLAGRISFKRLTPFLWQEVVSHASLETYLARGGFPPALLAQDDEVSYEWRQDFVSTFLERDLLQFAGFTPQTMRRLWQMLAHTNGQTVNYSKLGSSLGVSHTTIRNYIDLLEGTFMLIQLAPFSGNTKKRLVKSPKVYLSDTGIATALLNLKNFEQAAGHPAFGSLWETTVLANLYGHFPRLDYAFYRTNYGAEIDLVVSDGDINIAVECKATAAPALSSGNHAALKDINPKAGFVVAPVSTGYPVKEGIEVVSLPELIEQVGNMIGG
jgi:predicted AAA+ superfamily ATPase